MNLKKISILFFAVFIFSACTEKTILSSKKHIPIQTLSKIIFDIHLHDGTMNAYNNDKNKNIFLSESYYQNKIFKKYGCTDTLFKESIEYYSINGQIKDVYTIVLDSLNTMKSKLEQDRIRKRTSSRKKKIKTL